MEEHKKHQHHKSHICRKNRNGHNAPRPRDALDASARAVENAQSVDEARKRLDRAGNPPAGGLKAVSYHAWLGALRGRGENKVKRYFAASLERMHDKTHAWLNT